MKRTLTLVAALMVFATAGNAQLFPIPDASIKAAFAGQKGTFVVADCSSETMSIFNPEGAREKLPPCSSFKIWNTLAGLENGLISSADEAFYKWDGKTRDYAPWNRDQNLREAFGVSCVPAFQELARKVGAGRMQEWIDTIGYGDRDTSAGVDLFWLPAPGHKSILISPTEQAALLCRLTSGRLPVSEESIAVLRDIMRVRETDRGVLYGKTGSGTVDGNKIGWFVGFVETNRKTYAFACAAKGGTADGKGMRAVVEAVLKENRYL